MKKIIFLLSLLLISVSGFSQTGNTASLPYLAKILPKASVEASDTCIAFDNVSKKYVKINCSSITATNTASILLKADSSNVVNRTTPQLVAGTKTFSSPIRLKNAGGFYAAFDPVNITANRTLTSPDKSGVIATLTDIPGLPQPIGTIINEPLTSSFSNWTTVNTSGLFSPSISGSSLSLTSTNTTLALGDYIKYTTNLYGAGGTSPSSTNLEQWVASADVIVGTVGANSYGVWFGLQSTGDAAHSLNYSTEVLLKLDNTSKGVISYYFNNTVSSVQGTSPALSSVTAGDTINITLQMIKQTLIMTAINHTAGSKAVTASYEYPNNASVAFVHLPNAGQFAIGTAGNGNHKVRNFKVYSPQQKNVDVSIIGNSIIKGLTLVNMNDRAADKIMQLSSKNVSMYAQGGNKIEDINNNELTNINSGVEFIDIGTNNIGASGESVTTMMGKYRTLVTARQVAGKVLGTSLFVCAILPRSDMSVVNANDSLRINFTAGFVDTYTPYVTTGTTLAAAWSGDGVHLNEAGHLLYANILLNVKDLSGNLIFPLKVGYIPENRTPFYQFNNRIGVGLNNSIPNYAVDIYNNGVSGGTAMKIGASVADAGMYFSSNTSSNGVVSVGAIPNGSNYTSKTAGGSMTSMDCTNGVFNFYSVTSGVPAAGSTFGNTSSMSIRPSAVAIGSISTATAFLNIQGGAAGRSSINLASGVAPTTPNGGDIWVIGSSAFPQYAQSSTLTKTFTLSGRNAQSGTTYTVLTTDFGSTLGLTNTAARAVTLPALTGIPAGVIVWIKDEAGTAGTGNITVTGTSGNIDGAANNVISTNYTSRGYYHDGTNWFTR